MPELKENKIEDPEQLSVQSEDNFEFQEEVEDFVLIDRGEISPSDESGYIRKKGLLKLAAGSTLSDTQVYPFLASVELDLMRKIDEQLGLEELYIACCRNGNRTWQMRV